MIRKALTELCNVSTDPEINSKNYLFGMDFIDNLFHVTSILKKHCFDSFLMQKCSLPI